MANYPGALPSFGPDRTDGVDYNVAADINSLRGEVRAIATDLGTHTGPQGTLASRLATALTNITTLLGRFDGSGKLPHAGIAGFHSPTAFTTAPVSSAVSWLVDGGGTCHWQGTMILDSGVAGWAGGVVLAGAPAPLDAAEHVFLANATVTFADLLLNANWAGAAGFGAITTPEVGYNMSLDGSVQLQGLIQAQTTIPNGSVIVADGGMPPPYDGASHVLTMTDVLSMALASVTVTPNGGLVVGNGSGTGASISTAAAYSLDTVRAYQAGPAGVGGSVTLTVLEGGQGLWSGPALPGNGGYLVSLNNVSYFVGP